MGGNPYTQQTSSTSNYSDGQGYREPNYAQDRSPQKPQQPERGISYQRPYTTEIIEGKNHVAAGLLAIFLGVFGIHKFYMGNYRIGFVMLAVSILGGVLSFGLAAAVIEVISIVEGVIYLTMHQEDFERIYIKGNKDWF